MRKSMRLAVTGIAAAAAVASVAGFTAGNTVPTSTAGYGSAEVSGATATDISYAVSADGTTITGANLVFQGDQTGNTVQAGFGTTQQSCSVGSYDAMSNTTSVSCTGYTQSTADALTFTITVFS